MKQLLGFLFVIVSAFPMGIAEGKIIGLNSHYNFSKVFPLITLYAVGFALYLFGFMQIPTKIGFIIGVWEISAVTIGVTVAIAKQGVKFDREYFFLYVGLIAATYVLGWIADRIFTKAGI